MVLRALGRKERLEDVVLPVVASFDALVSMLLVGPLYLHCSVGLRLLSLLWFCAAGFRALRVSCAVATTAVMVIAIVLHAWQSRHRTRLQILGGDRVTDVWAMEAGRPDRNSLRLDREDHELHGRLVSVIQAGGLVQHPLREGDHGIRRVLV